MKRIVFTLGALLIPVLAAHMVLAAGLFKVGEKAPSFALTAITGETVGLDTYKGKVVVLGLFHILDLAGEEAIVAEVEKLLAAGSKKM
jgi:cytochrome c biogenesis protein CcmG/thiol:disulfide interchange protein DsbE